MNSPLQRSKFKREQAKLYATINHHRWCAEQYGENLVESESVFYEFTVPGDVDVVLRRFLPDMPDYSATIYHDGQCYIVDFKNAPYVHSPAFFNRLSWYVVSYISGPAGLTHIDVDMVEEPEVVQDALTQAFEIICADWFFKGQ